MGTSNKIPVNPAFQPLLETRLEFDKPDSEMPAFPFLSPPSLLSPVSLTGSSVEEQIQNAVNTNPDPDNTRHKKMEELFEYCRMRGIPLEKLAPIIRHLKDSKELELKDADVLLLQLIGFCFMVDLQQQLVKENSVFARLPENVQEELKNYAATILEHLKRWDVYPEIKEIEYFNASAIAEYNDQTDKYLLPPLKSLFGINHPLFRESIYHELFHAYQDASKKTENLTRIEADAFLMGALGTTLTASLVCDTESCLRTYMNYGALTGGFSPKSDNETALSPAGQFLVRILAGNGHEGKPEYSLQHLNTRRCLDLFRNDEIRFEKDDEAFLKKLRDHYGISTFMFFISPLLNEEMTEEEWREEMEEHRERLDVDKTFRMISQYKCGNVEGARILFAELRGDLSSLTDSILMKQDGIGNGE